MSEKFSLETATFAGPLETLFNLIEERKMSISEISLSEVCDAYLAYVENLPEMPLAETAQFIVVASTLLLIKSRTLLPTLELSTEERESVEELEQRLARYAVVRNAAKVLRRHWGETPFIMAQRAPLRPTLFSPAEASLDFIRNAARRLIATIPKPTSLAETSVAPILALEDVIQHLRKRLSLALRTRFSDLTKHTGDRNEVIVYFLAMLELVRNGSASVTQDALFSDMTIELESLTGAPRYGV